MTASDSTHIDARVGVAFHGSAGPEEIRHLYDLLAVLLDEEIVRLVEAVGIRFQEPTGTINRDVLESVVDEAERETFYREYRRIVNERQL